MKASAIAARLRRRPQVSSPGARSALAKAAPSTATIPRNASCPQNAIHAQNPISVDWETALDWFIALSDAGDGKLYRAGELYRRWLLNGGFRWTRPCDR